MKTSIAAMFVAALLSGFAHAAVLSIDETPESTALAVDGEAAATPNDVLNFEQGQWNIYAFAGAYTMSFDGHGEDFYLGGLAFEYFVIDDLSLGAEFLGYAVGQDGQDTSAFGFNLFTRYHFWKPCDWAALYVEGAMGLFQGAESVPLEPLEGSDFNFTLWAGLGGKIRVTDQVGVLLGVRYMHLSNGNTDGAYNPGLDGVGGYGGLLIKF